MSEFVWSQELSVGVPSMDNDHRKIINYMNALALAAERNAPLAELDAAFRRLTDFTRQHFSDEEKLMTSIAYDRIATHKAIHAKLLSELDGHYRQFHRARRLDDAVFRFLTFWLKSHICGIDRKYSVLVPGYEAAALAR